MSLQGRIAMVTGAGSGLGRAIALAFAAKGARLAINDVRRSAASEVVDEIKAAGGDAIAVPADVSDSVDVAEIFEETVASLGTLDILVNNAGIALVSEDVRHRMDAAVAAVAAGQRPQPLRATSSMSDSQWRRTLAVHLDGTFHCTREALRIMEPKGAGVIINIASVAGEAGLAGAPDYSAAKAGIIGLTKAVAREAIASGVRVNAIAPGFVDTPLLDALPPLARRALSFQIPAGRLGTVDEIACLALYLASDESGYTVGQVLSADGGYYI